MPNSIAFKSPSAIFLAKTIADFCFSVIVSPSISSVVFVSSAKDSNLQKSFLCCFAAAEALPPLLAISFLSLAGLVFSGFKLLSFISIVTFCKNSVFLFVGSLLSAWCWVGQGVGWSPVSVCAIMLRAGNGVRWCGFLLSVSFHRLRSVSDPCRLLVLVSCWRLEMVSAGVVSCCRYHSIG